MTRSYGDAEPAFDFDKNSHERAQQAIQDQARLEGRIMNAKSPCGTFAPYRYISDVSVYGG
jgi:hypothetical protein